MNNKKSIYVFLNLLINYFPLFYLSLGSFLFYNYFEISFPFLGYILIYIYLIPPITARLIIMIFGKPKGPVSIHSNAYLKWWFLSQLQVPYNRFSFLEEILRIVPGLYSIWLNIWGSRVKLTVYWSPRVAVVDRYLLEIQSWVVFGWGATLSAHLIIDKDDTFTLLIDPIRVDEKAIVGAMSMVSLGTHIHAGEMLPAAQKIPPYYEFKDGKRASLKDS